MLFVDLKRRTDAIAYKLRTRSRIVPILALFVNAICGIPFRLYKFVVKTKTKLCGSANILLIRADRIGDMILTTPVFEPLRERYPNAHITCMASSLSSQLIDGNPYIDAVMIYDPPWFDRQKGQKRLRSWLKTVRLIRAEKFDMAIDFRGNIFNFFLLMFLGGIPRRVSFDAALGSFLLTDPVPFVAGKHETDYFLDLVKAVGCKEVNEPKGLIVLSEEENRCAETFFRSNNIADDDVVIAVHPGAGEKRIYKRWPEERYCELGKALVQKYGAKIIVTGSKAEIDLASRVAGAIGENAVLAAGKIYHLKHLAAVLKRCAACIGTSTGPTHLAAAVGIPTVVLCGPEAPRRWHPLGSNHILIEKEMACRPCREESCPYDGRCLKLISTECVLDVIEPLLSIGTKADVV